MKKIRLKLSRIAANGAFAILFAIAASYMCAKAIASSFDFIDDEQD